MIKVTFMGAGSTVFAKTVIGDIFLTPALRGCEIALYDIDPERLEGSRLMVETLNRNLKAGATVKAFCGVDHRRTALDGADFVVNAIQVGGYEPATVHDFEIPKKYGVRQTIADTLGIGGIFRSLRTIPVVLDFLREMEAVCPNALFINYVNPMAMISGAAQQASPIQTVGLCHSVQGCARSLAARLLEDQPQDLRWKVAGVNHMAWLLQIHDGGEDLYPRIKSAYREAREIIFATGGALAVRQADESEFSAPWTKDRIRRISHDMVRLDMMLRFGYYVTESSEHNAEYAPYWIKATYPELIDRYGIPLDEYPRRCVSQIEAWERDKVEFVDNPDIRHRRSGEYASYILEAMVTDAPYRIHGNVLNRGLVTNLPAKACVEVPCMVDNNGINPCTVGDLPEQCAALNRTNVNVQLLTVEAALTRNRERVYQAAMLDPHTAAELSIDDIVALCDDLFEAHGDMIPPMQ